MNYRKLGQVAFRITIAGSSLVTACAAPITLPVYSPARAEFAPAEIRAPDVPTGDVDVRADEASLSLDELLAFADQNAPAIQRANAASDIVRAQYIDAGVRTPQNPELGVALGGRTVAGGSGYNFELSLEQQLELARQWQFRRELGDALLVSSVAETNEIRWAIHVEVHRLVVDLLLAREQLLQAERFVAFSRQMLTIATQQVDAGELSPLIVLVAEADVAQATEAVAVARELEESLQNQLASTIGYTHAELPRIDAVLPPVRPAPSPDTLLQTMAEHHPTLRTRELAVEAAYQRVALEEREAAIDPTIGVRYEHESPLAVEGASHVWMATLSVPLPTRRANLSARATAAAELNAADVERSATVDRIRSDLMQAAAALNAAAERVLIYETGVMPQLAENLALLQRAYELGEIDLHEVSQTRERLLNATAQYLDARIRYFETAAILEGLVGTELWPHEETAQ